MTDPAELPYKTTTGVFRREGADTAKARSAHKATVARRPTRLVARGEPGPVSRPLSSPVYRVGPTTCSSVRAS